MGTFVDNHLVNHVIFVLDESTSMGGAHAQQLVKAAAAEIAYLAKVSGSDEMNQETRVAIYTFADTAKCVVSERDVMRLPNIKDIYNPRGNTALVAATLLALDDAALVCQKYGNHAFLIYVLTDGEENRSTYAQRAALPGRLANLPENVTIAALVPEGNNYYRSVSYFDDTVALGFPKDNVAVWNTNASDGVQKAVQSTMRTATTNFMQARATGLRSTNSLFSMGTATINDATVKQTLTPISPDEYTLLRVTPPPSDYDKGEYWEIKDFTEDHKYAYTTGYTGYYELFYVKGKKPSEVIKPTKKIVIVERNTGLAYGGDQARQLLGLPTDKTVRVKAEKNDKYKVFFLSSANNRHLIPDTEMLVWDPKPLATRK